MIGNGQWPRIFFSSKLKGKLFYYEFRKLNQIPTEILYIQLLNLETSLVQFPVTSDEFNYIFYLWVLFSVLNLKSMRNSTFGCSDFFQKDSVKAKNQVHYVILEPICESLSALRAEPAKSEQQSEEGLDDLDMRPHILMP